MQIKVDIDYNRQHDFCTLRFLYREREMVIDAKLEVMERIIVDLLKQVTRFRLSRLDCFVDGKLQ